MAEVKVSNKMIYGTVRVEEDATAIVIPEKWTVDVLGTEYTIETRKISEDEYMKNNKFAGYCEEDTKLIVIADMTEKKFFGDMTEKARETYWKRTMRHELTHAFLNESGLSDSASVPACAWAKHEEMVDWIAIQFPKMLKAFQEVGCI